jgi:hypothetical protein
MQEYQHDTLQVGYQNPPKKSSISITKHHQLDPVKNILILHSAAHPKYPPPITTSICEEEKASIPCYVAIIIITTITTSQDLSRL